MPVAFIGHGSPMNTLENNDYTAKWQQFGQLFAAGQHSRAMNEAGLYARPKAVLMISAHWYGPGVQVHNTMTPPVIHDFMGFPPELFAFDYPAPGSPFLPQEVMNRLREHSAPQPLILTPKWGLDHGAWSVLAHIFPEADVPVTQFQIDSTRPARWHLEAGKMLRSLRDEGVLIIGSGNVVHNLGRMNMAVDAAAHPSSVRFHDYIVEALRNNDEDALCNYAEHPDAPYAVPTPEHFLPLLYIAGARRGEDFGLVTDGYEFSSLSMLSFFFGVNSSALAPKPAAAY